jgi:hypothetical protein
MVESSIQKPTFLDDKRDAYFRRSRGQRWGRQRDQTIRVMHRLKLGGSSILEIGRRPTIIHGKRSAESIALTDALRSPPHSYLDVEVGGADMLPSLGVRFDLIVFGFRLSRGDPGDYFSVAAEVDRIGVSLSIREANRSSRSFV